MLFVLTLSKNSSCFTFEFQNKVQRVGLVHQGDENDTIKCLSRFKLKTLRNFVRRLRISVTNVSFFTSKLNYFEINNIAITRINLYILLHTYMLSVDFHIVCKFMICFISLFWYHIWVLIQSTTLTCNVHEGNATLTWLCWLVFLEHSKMLSLLIIFCTYLDYRHILCNSNFLFDFHMICKLILCHTFNIFSCLFYSNCKQSVSPIYTKFIKETRKELSSPAIFARHCSSDYLLFRLLVRGIGRGALC